VSRENVEVVRRLWEGLERDPDMSWLALCDEHMEIRNPPGLPVADEYHGHQGARQWATEVWEVFSQFHHEVQELIDAGDDETVVSVQRLQGRMRHSQIEMNAEWATVWTLRGGKALRAHGYLTKAQALEAVGLRE
jgi:ketosteroid isomerase-like protein